MPKALSVYQRRRAPTPAELAQIPWLDLLTAEERARIEHSIECIKQRYRLHDG